MRLDKGLDDYVVCRIAGYSIVTKLLHHLMQKGGLLAGVGNAVLFHLAVQGHAGPA
jgi:hypothetical protein